MIWFKKKQTEKQKLDKLMKKLEKQVNNTKKLNKQDKKNEKIEKQLQKEKTRMINAIIELTDILKIQENNKTITKTQLQNKPIDDLIQIFELAINELKKIA